MAPGLCCAFAVYATKPASHRSEHSGESSRIWVFEFNECKYRKLSQFIDFNLNRPRLSVRPQAHVCSNIDERHGRWGAHRVAPRTTAGGGSNWRGVPTPRHPLRHTGWRLTPDVPRHRSPNSAQR